MTTPQRCLVERLGAAVAGVHELLDQPAAADELIGELVAENEDLRRRLARHETQEMTQRDKERIRWSNRS